MSIVNSTSSPTIINKDRITAFAASLSQIDTRIIRVQAEQDSAAPGSRTQKIATDILKLYKAHQLFGQGLLHLLEAGSADNTADGSITAAQSAMLERIMIDHMSNSEVFGKFVRRYAAREKELATHDGFMRGLRERGVIREDVPGVLTVDYPEVAMSVLSTILAETYANFRTFLQASIAS